MPRTLARTSGAGSAKARGRILEAARRQILLGGAGAAGSAQVARAAGVSKALVHYHFHDKQALLCGVAADCAGRIRRRATAQTGASEGANPVDEFHVWANAEFEAGDLGVLVRIAHTENVAVRRAAVEALESAGAAVVARVAYAFERLEIPPPLPIALLGELMTTVMVGDASTGVAGPDHTRRQLMDVLWLVLLRLGD